MNDIVRDENMDLYRQALRESTGEDQRRVLLILLRLLVAEEAAFSPNPRENLPLGRE
jgi:hypothetical protein